MSNLHISIYPKENGYAVSTHTGNQEKHKELVFESALGLKIFIEKQIEEHLPKHEYGQGVNDDTGTN